jgi:hypothetical protein
VDGAGKDFMYWSSLREYWSEYIQRCHALLMHYSVLRELPNSYMSGD